MIFDENKIIAQAYMSMLGEKKMDPVGKEDGDIDNDGDKDKSDAYLHARRKAISTSVKKEGIDIEMPKKSSMGKELEKDEDEMDDEDDEDDVKSKSMKVKNKTTDKENGQVNELSNDTLTRYSNSARGQARHSMAKLGGATSKGEVDKLSSTMTKRLKGNAAASRKMKEEVEELDELSIKKLLTYRSKATEKLGSDPAKDAKRKAGIGASGMKVKAKLKNEEVELDEANAMQMASAIEAYAKKSGGIDKDDMMKVASMLKRGDMKGAVKYAKTLDTDPKEWLMVKMGLAEATEDIRSHKVGDEVVLKNKNYSGTIVKSKGSDISFKNKSDGKHYKATHGMIHRNLSQENRYKEKSAGQNKKFDDAMASDMKRIDKSGALKKFGIGVKEASNPPFDMPYKKAEEPKKDKSGAVHSPMSRVKHLARQAMKNQMKEQHNIEITDYQADELIEAAGLQEISKATLGSYIKKAKGSAIGSAQVTGMGSSMTGQKTQDKAERNVQKRAKGINKAVDRLTKEDVDQIDELSKSTMRRYVNKSASDLAKTSMELGGSYAKGSGDSVSQNKMLDKMVSRKKGISKATERMAKESYEWDWNAIFEASDEEIDSLIEQLDGEELESFVEEFESLDEASYQSSTGSRQPMNANGQETLEPRAEADKAFSNAHKVVTAIADHPYKYNQHASQKPQAAKRPGDERNSEPKKTLSDIRKR